MVPQTEAIWRYWRIPFVIGWVLAFVTLKQRIANGGGGQPQLCYFEIGMFVYGLCYIVGAAVTGGAGAFWRLLPLDNSAIAPWRIRFAFAITAAGAAIGAALIAISYVGH
jgi:hypothetical protein